MLLNHHFWAPYKYVVVTVHADALPSACILMFWLTRDETGWEEGAFFWMPLRLEKIMEADIAARKGYRTLVR